MIAASFIGLLYWTAFAGMVVFLGVLIGRERDRRGRVRRMRERRLRRDYLNSLEPQRWDDRQAHPWEQAS